MHIKPNKLPQYQRGARRFIRRASCRGFTLHEGPSHMPGPGNGQPTRTLLQLTGNDKTGDLFQTWHLPADLHPVEARRYGSGDCGICGDCIFRAKPDQKAGPCYVNGVAINGIYKSWVNGNYPLLDELAQSIGLDAPATLEVLGSLGNGVRLGAYGDPVAMPRHMARHLVSRAGVRQGFTHQWRRPEVKEGWPRLVMASCESPEQVARAHGGGWRTYTAYPETLTAKEARQAIINASAGQISGRLIMAHCPASARLDYRETCLTCPLQCNGAGARWPWHIINAVHGAPSVMGRYKSLGLEAKWRAWL